MKIWELEEASGQPARLIRYLISEGIVPKPDGATRSSSYDERHLDALRRYALMKSKGVTSLDFIRAEIAGGTARAEATILRPAEGVSLRIEPEAMERLDIEAVVQGIRAELEALVARKDGSGK